MQIETDGDGQMQIETGGDRQDRQTKEKGEEKGRREIEKERETSESLNHQH